MKDVSIALQSVNNISQLMGPIRETNGRNFRLLVTKGVGFCPWREIQQSAFAHEDDVNKDSFVS